MSYPYDLNGSNNEFVYCDCLLINPFQAGVEETCLNGLNQDLFQNNAKFVCRFFVY
jgi:hypothetical protein